MNNSFGAQIPNNENPSFLQRATEFKLFCEEIDSRLGEVIAGGIQFVRDDLAERDTHVTELLSGVSLITSWENFNIENPVFTFSLEKYQEYLEKSRDLDLFKKQRAEENLKSGKCILTIAVTFPTNNGISPTNEWGVFHEDGESIMVPMEILDIIEYKIRKLKGSVLIEHTLSRSRDRGLTMSIMEIEFSD